MAADALAMQGARVKAAMVLILLFQNILFSATQEFTQWGLDDMVAISTPEEL